MYIGKVKYGNNTWPVGSTLYGTCDTVAGTAAKVVTMPDFDTLLEGVTIHVKFTHSNGAHVGNATLNVNNTGAKTIMRYGTTAAGTGASASWNAGAVVSFTYDGTYWLMNDWVNTDTDTTYSAGYGLTLSSTTFSLGYRWQAITKGLVYSRIMYATGANGLVGCSGILTVLCTRNNVVVNSTFLITTSHDKYGLLILLSSNSYTATILRIVVNSTGYFYIDIKDEARNIAEGTELTWYCAYIPISSQTVTTYTAFTSGAYLPDGFEAPSRINTTLGDNTVAIKNITRSGTTFTATRLNGTTFTFDQLDNNTTYTLSTGDSNGQIKVTPSSGSAYNVSVKGLGDRAFDSTAYLPLTGGKLERLASKISDLNNTSGSDNAWNKVENSILYLKSQNNAMAITIGKTTNERVALILVGHSDYQNYANIYGTLHLNKFGGDVYINNSKAWHAGNDGSGSGLDADLLDGYHGSSFVKFYLSPMTSNAPADSAKSWFTETMPSASGAIVYNVPGDEKTIIAGKSSGAHGHMLQLNYNDNYLRLLRYKSGSWKTTDWEKISAGFADSAGNADTVDGYHSSNFYTTEKDLVYNDVAIGDTNNWFYVGDMDSARNYSTVDVYILGIGAPCNNTIQVKWCNVAGWHLSRFIYCGETTNTTPLTKVGFYRSGGNACKMFVYLKNTYTDSYKYTGFRIYLRYNGSHFTPKTPTIAQESSITEIVELNYGSNLIANLSGNASTATQLQTARTIWGQSFNGTGNVSGYMSGVTAIEFTGLGSSSGHGGYIDFHYNGSTADYTSRLVEESSGNLVVYGNNLKVNGYPVFHSNHVLLSNGEDIVDDYGIGIVGCHGMLPANLVSDFASGNANYNTPTGISPYNWGQVLNFFYDPDNAHFLLYVSDTSSNIDMNSRNTGMFYRSGWATSSNPYYGRRPWRLILDNASILTYYGLMLDQTSTHSILKMAYPKTSNFYNVLQYGGANAGSADLIVGSDNKDTHIQGRDVYIDAGTYYNCMFVNNSNGYVGIGTTSPSYKLHVNGLCGATAHLVTSDIRLKDIQKYLSVSIEDIANAPLFLFKWKNSEDQKEYIGTSAQYWDEKLPELVSKSDDTVGTLALLYDVLGALSGITLAKEILQLKEEIKQLQALIAELKLLQK